MAILHELLKEMVKRGATDLHVTTGSPPQVRINGTLSPLDGAPFSPNDTKLLCYSILTEAQKHRFEEDCQLFAVAYLWDGKAQTKTRRREDRQSVLQRNHAPTHCHLFKL